MQDGECFLNIPVKDDIVAEHWAKNWNKKVSFFAEHTYGQSEKSTTHHTHK